MFLVIISDVFREADFPRESLRQTPTNIYPTLETKTTNYKIKSETSLTWPCWELTKFPGNSGNALLVFQEHFLPLVLCFNHLYFGEHVFQIMHGFFYSLFHGSIDARPIKSSWFRTFCTWGNLITPCWICCPRDVFIIHILHAFFYITTK